MDFIRMKQKYAEVRARLLRGEIVWLEILNIRDDQGKTLLHLACEKGDVEFVRLLVNRGADINALDRYELTPIYIAVSFGFREIVKFLIDQDRIKLDLRTKKGVLQARLLSSAAILDDYTILMLLLQSGKITCLEDKDRITTDSPFDGNFIEEDVKPIYRAILCSCHASLCIFIVNQLKEYIQTIVNLDFMDTNNSIFKEIFFGFSAKLQTMEEICLEEKRELQIYGVGSTDAILSRYLADKTTPILELSKYLREVITEMDFSDMEKILEDIKSLSEKAFNFRVALERVKYERQRQSVQSHSSTLAEKPIVDSWLDEFIPISPKIVKIRQVIQEEDQVLTRTAEQVHVEKRKSTTQPEPGTQREALLPNLSKRKKTSSLGQVLQPAMVCLERSS